MNNLFDFATSELSQDAVICWCVNWFNDDSNPALKKMSTEIIEKIAPISASEIRSVQIKRQLSKKVPDGKGKDIVVKIDVLLIINKSIAVIIEDKTNTSEHSEQIARYKIGLKKMIDDCIISTDELDNSAPEIITVYWKTGFFTDYDRAVDADKEIRRDDLITILEPYKNEHIIIREYLIYLDELHEKEQREKQYWIINTKSKSIWDKYLYLSWSHVGQYELLRSCFPMKENSIIKGKFDEPNQVYCGTSSGRPWTEMKIKYGSYSGQTRNNQREYSIFWRVDTANNGPYLSLRLYDHRDREQISDEQKQEHCDLFVKYRKIISDIIHETSNSLIEEKELTDRNNMNYREASFFSWNIDKELESHKADQSHLIETIRHINEEFLNRIEKDK